MLLKFFISGICGLIFLGFPFFSAWSQVSIAFIKVYKPDGKLLQLEQGFPYAHVAISFNQGWLNAHPRDGVQWTQNLSSLHFPAMEATIYSHPYLKITDEVSAGSLVGSPYDWNFDPRLWPAQFQKLNGLPGLSPFLLFKKLLELGFQKSS